MKAGNVRKLYILYWRHPKLDWENARTTELFLEITDRDYLRIPMRTDIDFRFMNVHRETESYIRNRDTVEYYRGKKLRKEPLIYIEVWKPLDFEPYKGLREFFISIDSDYRLKEFYKLLDYLVNSPEFP